MAALQSVYSELQHRVNAWANSWNTALRVTCMSAGGEGNTCISNKTRSKSAFPGFPWKLYIVNWVPCSPTDFLVYCPVSVVEGLCCYCRGQHPSGSWTLTKNVCVTQRLCHRICFVLELKCLCCEPQFVHPPPSLSFLPKQRERVDPKNTRLSNDEIATHKDDYFHLLLHRGKKCKAPDSSSCSCQVAV